jgi:hypothetical protein
MRVDNQERKQEFVIKNYEISYVCPKCDIGYMIGEDVTQLDIIQAGGDKKIMYKHIYDREKCDNKMLLEKKYPSVVQKKEYVFKEQYYKNPV